MLLNKAKEACMSVKWIVTAISQAVTNKPKEKQKDQQTPAFSNLLKHDI